MLCKINAQHELMIFNPFHSIDLHAFVILVCHTRNISLQNFAADVYKNVINNLAFIMKEIYNSSLFGLIGLPLRSNPLSSSVACLAMYLMKSSIVLPPSYLTGLSLAFLGAQ